MNIDQYIGQLLYRHQCITVPGFGAFLTEIQSAKFDNFSNSFHPPKKIISFNPNLKNNDGLLANHISQNEKLSYELSVEKINLEVTNWKYSLQNKEVLKLAKIGMLALNNEENLIFEASNQVNYLTQSFGLSAFVAPVVKRKIFEKEVENLAQDKIITLQPKTTISPSRNYLKYAAAVLISMGLTGYLGLKLYNDKVINDTQIVQLQVQKDIQNKIQEATFVIKSPLPNVTLAIKTTTMSYHIVAGSYRSEKNANIQLYKLTKLGFNAKRIKRNNFGLYPVIYGSYPSFNEANNEMKIIREKNDPAAWLLIKDL